MNNNKIECFCLSHDELTAYAGTLDGRILTIDVENFFVKHELHVGAGSLYALDLDGSGQYIAALGLDRRVYLLRIGDDGFPQLTDMVSTRNLTAWNDLQNAKSTRAYSQAIGFDSNSSRLAFRAASNALVEVENIGGELVPVHTARLHYDYDFVTLTYLNTGGKVLSGGAGEIILSSNGLRLRSWKVGRYNVHRLVPINDQEYLAATDDLRIVRINIKNDQLLFGEQFCRDDMEGLTYSPARGKAYATSYDRNIYEIDPETCDVDRICWCGPFKLQWISVLERSPSIAIVQCLDGGLYKVDIDSRRTIARIKNTPDSFWSAHRSDDGVVYFGGEGGRLSICSETDSPAGDGRDFFDLSREIYLENCEDTYIKRVAGNDGIVFAGCLNGKVFRIDGHEYPVLVADVGVPIRDLDVTSRGLFLCCEDGRIMSCDHDGQNHTWSEGINGEPIWSIAVNEERDILACGERRNSILFFRASTLEFMHSVPHGSRPKRMNWASRQQLLFVKTREIWSYDIDSESCARVTEPVGNTIEDFVLLRKWDLIFAISYTTRAYLFDSNTGELLDSVADQSDFAKGVISGPPPIEGNLPGRVFTYGRERKLHTYILHNERCLKESTQLLKGSEPVNRGH